MRMACLAISGTLSLLLICLALTNLKPVVLYGLGTADLGWLLLAGLLVGTWAGACLARLQTTKPAALLKQQQWEAQDAKLAASLRSDREKQLEAKIATLEAALKAALKSKG